jgi:hypothetical protein
MLINGCRELEERRQHVADNKYIHLDHRSLFLQELGKQGIAREAG